MMRKGTQPSAHIVDPGLDSRSQIRWKLKKRSVKAGVENLEGAHQVLNLACPRATTLRSLLLGLFDGRLKLGREFEFVLQKVVEQLTKVRELSLGKAL